jgi:hypothetical protein
MGENGVPFEDYWQFLAVSNFGLFTATNDNEMLHNEGVMTEEKAVAF